uniref:Uncharacterized protein n=1 Tax=Romanomermis culicivorax TaxID=13658 RepID=A0A915HJN1_ROMCU
MLQKKIYCWDAEIEVQRCQHGALHLNDLDNKTSLECLERTIILTFDEHFEEVEVNDSTEKEDLGELLVVKGLLWKEYVSRIS